MPTGLLDAANTALIPPAAEPVATYTPTIAQAKEASSTSYTPNATVVDDKDTVQGQLKTILDSDSVLMQQARTRAAQEANARGLLSSSLAVGDAQAKMAERALPIAQQDAGTYFTANQKTVDAQNAAKNFGAAAQNQAELANAQLGTDVAKTNAGLINEAGKSAADAANTQMLARLDAQTRLSVAQLDAQTKEKLAILDAQNRQLLQTNQNAANYFNNTVNAISAISQNQTMDKAAKDAAIATQLNLLNEALQVSQAIGGTTPANVAQLDLSQYFGGGTSGFSTPAPAAVPAPAPTGTAALPAGSTPAPPPAPAPNYTYAPGTTPPGAQSFSSGVQYISGVPIDTSTLRRDAYGNLIGVNVTTGQEELLPGM